MKNIEFLASFKDIVLFSCLRNQIFLQVNQAQETLRKVSKLSDLKGMSEAKLSANIKL